ncbi:MAG TPA: hypothetical protein VGR21_11075, partial [Cryptosporangiaceae bacterium]|nr:hypothetical protein [Cryptosporangiaceae bacterium]
MKRHATDTVSLVFGLLFAAAVAWWAIVEITGGSARLPAAWIGVATLLLIGIVGLVSALRPQREPDPQNATTEVAGPGDTGLAELEPAGSPPASAEPAVDPTPEAPTAHDP